MICLTKYVHFFVSSASESCFRFRQSSIDSMFPLSQVQMQINSFDWRPLRACDRQQVQIVSESLGLGMHVGGSSAPVMFNQSSDPAQFVLIKPVIKLNNSCSTREEGNCTFFSPSFSLRQPLWNVCCEEASSRGEASLDWHVQMNEQSIERSGVYLFHIITVNISNFHHEYCSVPWQALIARRHPSGEMMVLDGRQTLGVRLRDERGEGGRELITLLLPGTEPPSREASPGPVWGEEDPARHITSLFAPWCRSH